MNGNLRKIWNLRCQNPGWRIQVLPKVVSLCNFIIGTYFSHNNLNFSSPFALFFGVFTEINTFGLIQDGGSKMAGNKMGSLFLVCLSNFNTSKHILINIIKMSFTLHRPFL